MVLIYSIFCFNDYFLHIADWLIVVFVKTKCDNAMSVSVIKEVPWTFRINMIFFVYSIYLISAKLQP